MTLKILKGNFSKLKNFGEELESIKNNLAIEILEKKCRTVIILAINESSEPLMTCSDSATIIDSVFLSEYLKQISFAEFFLTPEKDESQ